MQSNVIEATESFIETKRSHELRAKYICMSKYVYFVYMCAIRFYFYEFIESFVSTILICFLRFCVFLHAHFAYYSLLLLQYRSGLN